VIDYYKMQNVQADTRMRSTLAGEEGHNGTASQGHGARRQGAALPLSGKLVQRNGMMVKPEQPARPAPGRGGRVPKDELEAGARAQPREIVARGVPLTPRASDSALRRAVLLQEILGPPVCRRGEEA